MMTAAQLDELKKQLGTNETVIYREYLQLVFLKALYDDPRGKDVYFKGGTAIHLLFGAPRFSEDLDFTVGTTEASLLTLFDHVVHVVSSQENITVKRRATIVGNRWLMTAQPVSLRYPIYLTLDFSFRERVLHPQVSPLVTTLPIIFTSLVHHLSAGEILAEKIRAIMTRRKGRDLYDLWYLMARGTTLNQEDVKKKLAYYRLEGIANEAMQERISSFPRDAFVSDLRPFVPVEEREKLSDFYDYVQTYLKRVIGQ